MRCIVNRQCDILMGSSMGEMYCKQTVQYSNGQFYGKESNGITKTLFCVMIKSVCRKYMDIVAMVSMTNIDANKLYTVWKVAD